MKQVRFIPIEDCGLQVREAGEGQAESRRVEGKPIIFGVRSVNLTPWSESREVYEVLEPGCISQDLISRSDIILNINHSTKVTDVLGRCKNGKGTLDLNMRENYIECGCDLPNTNNANDTLELIKRGDITGMSFAFEDDYQDTENGVSYERTAETHDGKEVWLRHVKKITGLYDVAIVTHPAYEQTSVGVREISDRIDAAIDEQIKREAGSQETDEEREAREKAEREQAERDANGGETNAEKAEREAREQKEREERELEEQAQRHREQQAMRMRHQAMRLRTMQEMDSLNY